MPTKYFYKMTWRNGKESQSSVFSGCWQLDAAVKGILANGIPFANINIQIVMANRKEAHEMAQG